MRLVRAPEHRQEQLASVDHAPEVDPEEPLEVVDRVLLEQLPARDARVVHQHLSAAVLSLDRAREALHLLELRHVDFVPAHPRAARLDPPRRLGEPVDVDVRQRELAALAREPQRDRPSDPARRTRHHSRPASKRLHARMVRSPVSNGIVSAGNPFTAAAGAEVLRAGGNAVDAAVAAAFASFVAEPLLSNAGGAGMMTVARPGEAPAVIDFFSTAPRAQGVEEFVEVTVDFGSATQIFHVGRGSVAVPLALDGLIEASEHFGRLSVHDVVQPAVRMAREGVPLTPEGAHVFAILWPILSRDAETMRVLARGDRPPVAGTMLVNADLSELLAELGRLGAVPPRFHAALAAFGIDRDDLATARVEIAEPLSIDVGEWRVCTSPRPGGRLVAHILAELAAQAPESDEAAEILRLAEASRRAHRERQILTAPGSTTHVSVVDADGAVASVTLTNGEGCGHVVPGTGVSLNNFLGEEDLNPHGFHLHAPGTRLPTMIAPTVALRRGEPALAVGSGGSNRIRSTVAQVLHRVVRLSDPIARAVLAPRVHAEEDAAFVELEGLRDAAAAVRALEARFGSVYAFEKRDFFFGGAHCVLRAAGGELTAAADPRRGGAVASPSDA